MEELAAALAEQELTSTSKPEPVSLDGHRGLYMEPTVPAEVKFADCEAGYVFWEGSPSDAHHVADSPGTVERTWILDVDGERVVLNALAAAGVTDEQVEELADIVESVHFVEPQ